MQPDTPPEFSVETTIPPDHWLNRTTQPGESRAWLSPFGYPPLSASAPWRGDGEEPPAGLDRISADAATAGAANGTTNGTIAGTTDGATIGATEDSTSEVTSAPGHAPATADKAASDGIPNRGAACLDAVEPRPKDAAWWHAAADDLQKQGRAVDAEAHYRAALALAPERSDTWANLGLAVLREGRAEEAVECARQALRLDPDNVEAFNHLGIALHALNALPEAENHFRGVLRLVPDHANALLNLGVIRQSLGHQAEAEALYRRARALGADAARTCNNLALALAELGRIEDAETACREALAARPDYPEAAVNLGMILLMRGKLAEAWPLYEARWDIPPLLSQNRLPEATRWTGAQPVAGKTVLLLAEQGFGDTLQFCRYATMVAGLGASVILAVPDALNRLMWSLPGIDRVVSQDDPLPAFDLHCPLMSLPRAFATIIETIPGGVPYLEADPDAVGYWRSVLIKEADASALRVGLVWAGARREGQPHAAAIDRRRSMTLADMAPLGRVPARAFVSLQLGPPASQIETAPFPVIDVGSGLTDFAATAALIEALDLVITVDTAVAHVAGALGRPVWLLSRFDGCWRWLRDRDDTPWYPTMRLFRQTSPGDWAEVMGRVAEALAALDPAE